MKREPQRWLALAGATLLAALALSPFMDARSDTSLAWHMVQHLVLIFIVPVLFLLAHPGEWIETKIGTRLTVAIVRALHAQPMRALTSPAASLATLIFTLWVTHFTSLYEAALQHPQVHLSEHLLFFVSGLFFWLPVTGARPLRPLSYPARLLYLFLALPQGALLAVALYAARAPLYPHYVTVLGSSAAALADQRTAAAIMWAGGGMIIFCALLCVLGAWARRERTATSTAALGTQ